MRCGVLPTVQCRSFVTGSLNPAQMVFFAKPRAVEELYDLNKDPFELKNLATEPDYAQTLKRLRYALEKWQAKTKDFPPKVVRLMNFIESQAFPLLPVSGLELPKPKWLRN